MTDTLHAQWRNDHLRAAPAAFRAALRVAVENWAIGSLTFVLPTGQPLRIDGKTPGPDAVIRVHDYRFIRRAFASGDIGFAEGYMAGEWETPDLSAVLTAFALNFDKLSALVRGNPLMRLANLLFHRTNRNDREGSKRNIHAHYDLGNAFYSQWLDPTMTYSSALYDRDPNARLEAAQARKYEALAQSIGLTPDKHVLEIGCGWGGFVEYAAKKVGARVTAVTISKAQHDFARRRLFALGLADKVDIRLMDYRDVEGRFDGVASIEMFEAVGEEYWPTYFDKVHDLLAPSGRAGLQIITIRDELFAHYRKQTDFIQRYVFPGGMLPSETRLKQETDRAGLSWENVRRFGQDYADTLADWNRRFETAWDDIRPLGFDERFRRLWKFYLAYCEAGFRTERTNVIQLGLSRN
ncbi:SAM-dependent methyltransferase [Caulobacter hibisci]|uniref:Class I SAM-dependent methyltransferase n=1 Tax=Caulobacter hibisci TaxID=2035993 RepID=A0ABS0SXJ1_9CAUL|nr:cyclopropane-fatty-acyl-phospholipid synthase family protein [Caulobacter hibisci]MBI1684362.1 class I SAM-dependent methyltransferase [Caulobacter hibisci]